MSQSAVSRIWRAFGLKPQQTEAFKLSPDPQFIDKVRDIVGLYLNPPEAAVVLCVDEKSQIQALDRSAPVLPLLPGVPERRSHDYVRYGTTNLYAALDVASGQVLSEMTPRHRADEFRRFLNRIDAAVPAGLDVHDLVAWKRRGAAALLRPACRGLHPRWDRVLFVRQARGRRVGGEVLPRCLRSLQPRHSGRGGCRRRHPPTARDRPGPGRLPRSERSRMGCAAGSGDLEARRVRRDRQALVSSNTASSRATSTSLAEARAPSHARQRLRPRRRSMSLNATLPASTPSHTSNASLSRPCG
jgi:hypothetical protein